jgi:NAD(P)-dependent dehydrogenase (short-subunit alcohol dehydrogenase family)
VVVLTEPATWDAPAGLGVVSVGVSGALGAAVPSVTWCPPLVGDRSADDHDPKFLTGHQIVPSCLSMSLICDGRVVIVTGAGRGIGRGHALELARQGAKVVVNDIGAELDGTGGSGSPAQKVVDEIVAGGGAAVVNGDDVADWDGAQRLVRTAVEAFGRLDVVVNNAGFVRDRMFANTSEDEWDAVVRVHLKGHFAVARWAAAYWRDRAKAGEPVDARIVNTSSGAGLLGSVGQAAYSAAKGGIATLTLVQAAELGRYGVTANAIAPSARTRMTETAFAEMMAKPDDAAAFDAMAADNVAPLVVWLGSTQSAHVTGRMFEVEGGRIAVADGWQHGEAVDKGARWSPDELGPVVDDLLNKAPRPAPVYGAS